MKEGDRYELECENEGARMHEVDYADDYYVHT